LSCFRGCHHSVFLFNDYNSHHFIPHFVATLALGLQPRQGLVKVWAKYEVRESHFMLLGVQESVREWTLTLWCVFHSCFRKLLTRVITLLWISSQSKVYRQSYGPPKLWESQLWEYRDSHLGVPGQNDIWVLVP
jgi:hypothetical protein